MSEKFTTDVDLYGLRIISPSGVFKFQSGEVDQINDHLNFIARMAGWPAMPKAGLKSGAFTAAFTPEGAVILSREEDPGILIFDITEVDQVIEKFKESVAKQVDFVTLRGGPRRGVAPATPDIVLEGR